MKSNSFGCHEKISTTCHFHCSHYESSIQTGESIFSETVLNIPILALSPMFSLPRTPFKFPLSIWILLFGSYYINKYLCVLPSPQWFLPPLNSCSIYSLFHFFAFCLILVSYFHKKVLSSIMLYIPWRQRLHFILLHVLYITLYNAWP